MKTPKTLYIADDSTPQGYAKLSVDDWMRRIRQALGPKKDDPTTDMLAIAMDGESWELQIDPEADPEDQKRVKTLQSAITKAWKTHLTLEAKIAKDAEKQKAEAEQRGMKIIVAAKKGEKIAELVAHNMVDNLSKAMKGKFIMDGMSLKLAKGAKPSEADFSEVLGALSNLKGAASDAADQAGFYMADAITLANEAGFDGNQLLEQVAKEFGVKLFTAQQAQRLGEFFPPEARIPGLSMSGHQEIMYGAGQVKDPKKLEAVIEKIKEGKVIDVTTTGNGKEIPDRKPYSKNEVRRMMDEAADIKPKKPKPAKGGAGGTPMANFLYLTSDAQGDDVFYISEDMSLKACEDPAYAVIDLMTLTILDKKGNPKFNIAPLGDEWFEAIAAPKPKKAKAAKPGPIVETEGVTVGEEDDGMPPV